MTSLPEVRDYEIKSAPAAAQVTVDAEKGIVEAIVGVTGIVDHGNDVVEPGAYTKTLKERNPKVCWAHDWKNPVGKVLQAVELFPGDERLPDVFHRLGAGALYVKTQFNLRTTRGRDAFEDVRFWGDEGEWSIGYDCTPARGGSSYKDEKGIRHIPALALFEVSPVLHGMAPLTATLSTKGLAVADLEDLADYEEKGKRRFGAPRDADRDGIIWEGTPRERPAGPRVRGIDMDPDETTPGGRAGTARRGTVTTDDRGRRVTLPPMKPIPKDSPGERARRRERIEGWRPRWEDPEGPDTRGRINPEHPGWREYDAGRIDVDGNAVRRKPKKAKTPDRPSDYGQTLPDGSVVTVDDQGRRVVIPRMTPPPKDSAADKKRKRGILDWRPQWEDNEGPDTRGRIDPDHPGWREYDRRGASGFYAWQERQRAKGKKGKKWAHIDFPDDEYEVKETDRGQTQPGEGQRYPINNRADLHNAIQAFGRSKTPEKTKRWIIRRARELGAIGMLPDSWNVSKTLSPMDVPWVEVQPGVWKAMVDDVEGPPPFSREGKLFGRRGRRRAQDMLPIDADSDGFVYDGTYRQRPAPPRPRPSLINIPTNVGTLGGADALGLARGFDVDLARSEDAPTLPRAGARENPRNWSSSTLDGAIAALRDATRNNRSNEDGRRLRTLRELRASRGGVPSEAEITDIAAATREKMLEIADVEEIETLARAQVDLAEATPLDYRRQIVALTLTDILTEIGFPDDGLTARLAALPEPDEPAPSSGPVFMDRMGVAGVAGPAEQARRAREWMAGAAERAERRVTSRRRGRSRVPKFSYVGGT